MDSGGDDLACTWRGRQHRELDVEAHLEGFGNGRELAYGGVTSAPLQGGDHRLGDLHALGQLQLRKSDLFAGRTDTLTDQLRMDG